MANNKLKDDEILSRNEVPTVKFTSSSQPIKLENAELIALWERTEPISSKNPNIYRLDPADAIIKLSDFNKKTAHGWVVQPIDLDRAPIEPDINHLVALHWMNAESRLKSSKKNDKSFMSSVTRVPDPLSDDNMKKQKVIQNKNIQNQNKSSIWSKEERNKFKAKKK